MKSETRNALNQVIRECLERRQKGPRDRTRIRGRLSYTLRGPDGRIKAQGANDNIVTDKGDELFASLSYTAAPTFNIKLGKATTAPSKTYNNAGAWIADADSENDAQRAMEATYPKVKAGAGNENIVQYKSVYGAGVATETWNRAALVDSNENNPTDGTLTYAIALLDPRPVAKGSDDTLEVLWEITFTGS